MSGNMYEIPYGLLLHDLTILKMQHMDDLNSDGKDEDEFEKNLKLISLYYDTIADLNDALNHYIRTHEI